jgi:hypothetical protein
MQFTLGEIFGITRNMQKLTDKELPISISYRLLKFLRDCSGEMETLEKTRIKLVEKYAEKKEEGAEEVKDLQVAEEHRDKFQEEFTNLLAEEVEIDFEPISIGDLGNISMSTNDLIPMQKIIREK